MPQKRSHDNIDVDDEGDGDGDEEGGIKTIQIVNSKSKSVNREKFMCEMCSSLLKLAFQIFFLDCCPTYDYQYIYKLKRWIIAV